MPVLDMLIMLIVETININNILMLCYTNLSTAFFDATKWSQLIKKCLEIEEHLHIKRHFKWYHKVSFWVIVCHVIMITTVSFNISEMAKLYLDFNSIFPFLIMYLNHYGFFVEIFIINIIIQNIRCKIEKITKYLHLLCNKQIKLNENNFSTQIRKLSKTYRKTFEVINLYKQHFWFSNIGLNFNIIIDVVDEPEFYIFVLT